MNINLYLFHLKQVQKIHRIKDKQKYASLDSRTQQEVFICCQHWFKVKLFHKLRSIIWLLNTNKTGSTNLSLTLLLAFNWKQCSHLCSSSVLKFYRVWWKLYFLPLRNLTYRSLKVLHFVNFPILLNGKVTRFYESLDHIPEPQSQCVALLH